MSPSTGDHFGFAFTAPGDRVKGFFDEETKNVNYYIQKYKVKNSKRSKDANVIVLASGNLGLVYLTDHAKRLKYEQMNQVYP